MELERWEAPEVVFIQRVVAGFSLLPYMIRAKLRFDILLLPGEIASLDGCRA
jgi:hypothetical protein